MKTRPLVLATFLVIAVTGCVSYKHEDLSPANAHAAFDARTLNDPGLRTFLQKNGHAASDEWDLERLTLAAFYFSPELDVARGKVAEAEGGIRAAEARPNPSLRFAPGYNRDASGVTPWILGYALNVPVELGGKRRLRTAEAHQIGEVARLDLASAAWAARSGVRQSLVNLHAVEATAALWRDQQPLLADAAKLANARVEAGDASPLVAAQASVALSRAELAARESERGVILARSHLAEAIGIPLLALDQVLISYRGLADTPPSLQPTEARGWAAVNRADLLSALASYSAAQVALQREIAAQYPDVSIGPGYELDQGEGKWSLALSITLPVFHQNQGPIASAQARRQTAAARFIATQNRVLAEVDRALAEFASVRDDLATISAMRGNLEQQARTLQVQYSAGETSRLDVVRARIELADSARAELEARVRAERALGAIENAIQRPLPWPEAAWREAPRTSAQ